MTIQELIESLEETCPTCEGTGLVDWCGDGHKRSCKSCNHTGKVPTEAGAQLLVFLHRHLEIRSSLQ